MNTYQIADLEKLTGIKAHTIRIWERRYQLIEPHRTETNIRYYDDEQVKKLLKVATLLNQGLKISKIAELSDREMNALVEDVQRAVPGDTICDGFINGLTASMLSFDEAAFEKVFSSAVLRLGMYAATVRVFYPFLKKTGLMWSINEAMPVQEHFASAIIRRKLLVAIDGLPAPVKKSKTFVLFLPPGEWHETGLLLADYILRFKGYKTYYLSQNVPLSNVQDVINNVAPSHVFTLYVARQDTGKIQTEVNELAARNKKCSFLIGGPEELLGSVKKAKNTSILYSPTDLLSYLKR